MSAGLRDRSQHEKAHRRYLEHKRAHLVRELAAINAQLRYRTPDPEDEAWDYDPRAVSA